MRKLAALILVISASPLWAQTLQFESWDKFNLNEKATYFLGVFHSYQELSSKSDGAHVENCLRANNVKMEDAVAKIEIFGRFHPNNSLLNLLVMYSDETCP